MPAMDLERQSRRLQLVEEHVRLENQHDLDGIMTTFGASPRYDDEPWNAHYAGRDGVRSFYSELLCAMPDLQIDVQRRHISEATIVLEVIIRGHHLGAWRGLPPTRSEERRVGKECRSRGSPYHEKKKRENDDSA